MQQRERGRERPSPRLVSPSSTYRLVSLHLRLPRRARALSEAEGPSPVLGVDLREVVRHIRPQGTVQELKPRRQTLHRLSALLF